MSIVDRRPPFVSTAARALLVRGGAHKALFLDRDGVVNVDHGYVHSPEQVSWVPGLKQLLSAAIGAGFVPVIVTNQAGIARGFYSETDFLAFAGWMHAQFEAWDTPVLATYYCPHHPLAGVGAYCVQCDCRKPNPGMLQAACGDWHFDPASSVMLGDRNSDVRAALNAGIGAPYLLNASGERLESGSAREITTLQQLADILEPSEAPQ